jgi:hypothetical protein
MAQLTEGLKVDQDERQGTQPVGPAR